MAGLKALFGANLRQVRKARGWSQAQVAEAASLSLEMVGRLERGVAAPSFDAVETLAKALDVQPSAFFSESGASVCSGFRDKRSRLIQGINRALADATEDELRMAGRVIAALLER